MSKLAHKTNKNSLPKNTGKHKAAKSAGSPRRVATRSGGRRPPTGSLLQTTQALDELLKSFNDPDIFSDAKKSQVKRRGCRVHKISGGVVHRPRVEKRGPRKVKYHTLGGSIETAYVLVDNKDNNNAPLYFKETPGGPASIEIGRKDGRVYRSTSLLQFDGRVRIESKKGLGKLIAVLSTIKF